jgi:uncharacterized protein (TIGR02594 family)
MDRRDLILNSLALTAVLATSSGFAKAIDGADYSDFLGPLPAMDLFGNKPATDVEVATSIRILDGAPRIGDLLAVARYFEAIVESNADGECYNAAWSTRWNPVIVGFYMSTTITDKDVAKNGDTIAWCAAFVNWCLLIAGFDATHNPMSGSFRTYGTAVEEAKPGDIVVFKHRKRKLAKAGHGHVGLFVGYDGERIRVLGGNQKGGKRYSSVCVSTYPKRGRSLVLHSFRRPTSPV